VIEVEYLAPSGLEISLRSCPGALPRAGLWLPFRQEAKAVTWRLSVLAAQTILSNRGDAKTRRGVNSTRVQTSETEFDEAGFESEHRLPVYLAPSGLRPKGGFIPGALPQAGLFAPFRRACGGCVYLGLPMNLPKELPQKGPKDRSCLSGRKPTRFASVLASWLFKRFY
jgi:hypothetical protein